jgi:large subunit ribosomal protein L3
MLYGLIGNKVGMTQIFNEKGNVIPVTIIKIQTCTLIEFKSFKNNGYNAIQIAFGKNIKKLKKPELGFFLKNKITPFQFLKEFKVETLNNYKIGMIFDTKIFKIGDKITITANSIGKGNAGNIKKNNFKRGPMSHGSKHHRLQGSIGAGTTPGRVIPGKKMPGRLGNTKITIKNLEIVDLNTENEIILIKGSIPGKKKNLLKIIFNK